MVLVRRISRIASVMLILAVVLTAGGCSRKNDKDIIKAAPMHDLGKIAVQDKILRKEGKFNDDEYKEICRQLVTMDWCLRWFKDNAESYPETAYYFIVVEKNPKPRNENDIYSVTLAIVDAEKKPILVKGSLAGYGYQKEPESPSIVAVAVPTRTIDKKLINALNSEKSVLIKK